MLDPVDDDVRVKQVADHSKDSRSGYSWLSRSGRQSHSLGAVVNEDGGNGHPDLREVSAYGVKIWRLREGFRKSFTSSRLGGFSRTQVRSLRSFKGYSPIFNRPRYHLTGWTI